MRPTPRGSSPKSILERPDFQGAGSRRVIRLIVAGSGVEDLRLIPSDRMTRIQGVLCKFALERLTIGLRTRITPTRSASEGIAARTLAGASRWCEEWPHRGVRDIFVRLSRLSS